MPCIEVAEGGVYTHDQSGLRYHVIELLPDLTSYEATHELNKKSVIYVQLENGEKFPAGTRYIRTEADFKQQFTAV